MYRWPEHKIKALFIKTTRFNFSLVIYLAAAKRRPDDDVDGDELIDVEEV